MLLKDLKSNEVRLLTLTGPAGIGKTRLGLQVARDLEAHFAQGVVFASLAALRDAQLLPNVIARALGLHEPSEDDISEHVIAFLRRALSVYPSIRLSVYPSIRLSSVLGSKRPGRHSIPRG